MSLLSEFKDFALKGNVMDMAVGVIIGAAFGDIVTSLTDNFIQPLIQAITGSSEVSVGGTFVIRGAVFNWGAFVSAVINFLIIALILFLMLKAINKATKAAEEAAKKLKKEEAKAEEEAAPAEPSDEVKLLTEIKDLLASK